MDDIQEVGPGYKVAWYQNYNSAQDSTPAGTDAIALMMTLMMTVELKLQQAHWSAAECP